LVGFVFGPWGGPLPDLELGAQLFVLRHFGGTRFSSPFLYRHVSYAYLPAGVIEPCLPTRADMLVCGGLWVHEIKHDGLRIVARKNGAQVKL
jgi:hypothetical protein